MDKIARTISILLFLALFIFAPNFVANARILRNIDTTQIETLDQLIAAEDIHLTSNYKTEQKHSSRSLESCKNLVFKVFSKIPQQHISTLDLINLNFNPDSNRGMANSHEIHINCSNLTSKETVAVLIHEIGHIVDGGYLTGNSEQKSNYTDLNITVKADDKSTDFYNISWQNNTQWNTTSTENDFCSIYGSTDPYEDFAECYIYFALHQREFLNLAKDNEQLRKKYRFMQTHVFNSESVNVNSYYTARNYSLKNPYDITKLDYDFISFWR